jgi:hypothetical protein
VDLFPHGRDYAWLGIDSAGHVGIFTNAGEGPIPTAVLCDRAKADLAEAFVRGLPERGGCKMIVSLPRPDDFIAFARRGLFAYDWQDAHRTSNRVHCYELLARPDNPVSVDELDADLGMLARKARFESVRFAENSRIVVAENVES